MTDARPRITPLKNGPLRVTGLERVDSVEGPIACGETAALCRCGHSQKKPFCDGTHAHVGFSDEKTGDAADRRVDYLGKGITIHDNRSICAHAAFCTNELASVFRYGQKPWIDADGASVEAIVELVHKCPSGAISYSLPDAGGPDLERPPSVFAAPRGPYVVKGGCELEGVSWAQGASQEHFTLCRCGGSKNKPFCDGTHGKIWKAGADAPTR